MNLASLEASPAQSTPRPKVKTGLRRFWIMTFLAFGVGICLIWMIVLGLLLGYGLFIFLNYVL